MAIYGSIQQVAKGHISSLKDDDVDVSSISPSSEKVIKKLALKVPAFLSICSGNLTFSTCYKPNFLFEQRAFFILFLLLLKL